MPQVKINEKIRNISRFWDLTYWYRYLGAALYAGYVPHQGVSGACKTYPILMPYIEYSEYFDKGAMWRRKTLGLPNIVGTYITSNMYVEPPVIKIDFGQEAKKGSEEETENIANQDLQSEMIRKILDDNNWNIKEKNLFEEQFHIGDRIIKPYVANNKLKLDYVNGLDFFATRIENKDTISGVIVTTKQVVKGKKIVHFTRLEWHYGLDEEIKGVEIGRVIRTELYKSDKAGGLDTLCNHLHLEIFGTLINEREEFMNMPCYQPTFVQIKNPRNNNKDLRDSRGLGGVINAIDTTLSLDEAFDAKSKDNKHGGIKVMVPEAATETFIDSKGKPYRHYDPTKPEIFVHSGGEQSEDSAPQVSAPILRTEQHIASMNADLDLMSSQIGVSPGSFRFDGKTIQTATAKIIEKADTANTIREYEGANEIGYIELLMLIKWYSENKYINEVFTFEREHIKVDWNDNIAEDDASKKDREITYVDKNMMSAVRYYMRNEGMTEEEAKEVYEEAQKAFLDKETTAQSIFGFNDPDEDDPDDEDDE